MEARHGSVTRSHCGAAAAHGAAAAQKSPGAISGGYIWSTTPSMASAAGVVEYAELAVAEAASARL